MEFAERIRRVLAQRIGQERFELWFDGVDFHFEKNGIQVVAGSTFIVDRIRRDFVSKIEAAAEELGCGAGNTVEVIVKSNPLVAKPDDSSDKPTRPEATRPRLLKAPSALVRGRRFRKFEQFVKGDCNQLARASVDLVMRQPGEVSPLVVHGPNGVGKTHLLEAMWCKAKSQPRARVLYITAEQFTSYFLEGLKGNGLPAFRRKYRQADLLLIDDIQFFAGKQATIVELCYTIDDLAQQHKQLVLTADRPPAQLAGILGADVANRLSGGLVCGMKPMDTATLEEISRRWAAEREISMDESVHAAIAMRMRGDARQLSGVLNRLRATSLAHGESITVRMAMEVIHELVPTQARIIRLKDVSKTVCHVFGLEAGSLQQQARSRTVSKPRMLAMWFARKHTSAGLHEISQYFGRRSHSSAVTAHNAVDSWLAQGTTLEINGQSCDVRDIIGQIESALRAG